MFYGLPDIAYASRPSDGHVIMIKRGESNYYPVITKRSADEMNRLVGVTKAQAQAMFIGSLFGWDVPGANPAVYDDHGQPIKR